MLGARGEGRHQRRAVVATGGRWRGRCGRAVEAREEEEDKAQTEAIR
jgi:hypothetical protein